MLGAQASSPADFVLVTLVSNRAGEDACAPSMRIWNYPSAFLGSSFILSSPRSHPNQKWRPQMFKFDRKKFFEAYRSRFGPLTQNLVDALEFLLTQIENDARFGVAETDRRQIAYCLGTFKWETAHTLRPIDEIGTAARFNRIYGPQTKVGKVLGNTKEGDGALFHGRGYVQLTGRRNYTKAKNLTGVDHNCGSR